MQRYLLRDVMASGYGMEIWNSTQEIV